MAVGGGATVGWFPTHAVADATPEASTGGGIIFLNARDHLKFAT
jgi:hypothetical protein